MITLLTVDDARPIRTILRSILQVMPEFRVLQADGGRQGISMLTSNPIDVLITDWSMAELSGIDLVTLVRNGEHGLNRFLPIIMLTGHAEREQVFRARDAGVDEFVVKPIRAAVVFKRLEAVIHHRRDFVRSANYFGPDRRRRRQPFVGPDKRVRHQHLEYLDF